MELTLKGKNLVFAKNRVFKATYNLQFLFYEIRGLKKNFVTRLYLNREIGKLEVFNEKRMFFYSLTFSRYKQFGIKEVKSSNKHKFI